MTSDAIAVSLTDRVAAHLGGAVVTDVHPMSGGFSSLTYRACVDGVAIVIKVAPPGRRPVGNRDVLRQARLLTALHERSTVPVPEVLFVDPGGPPDLPPLFGMRFIHGDADEPMLMDRNRLPSADVVAGRAQALTTVLARLHHVSLSDLRLSDEPVTSPSAEASRWMGMFHGGAASPALSLGHRLQDTAPEPLSPVLQHGDFRLGNAICQGRNVAAVIDWEIWSIGDPRTDLAWLLMRAAPDQLHAGMPPAPGMPTSEDLLTSYASEVDSPPAEMAWFSALVRYKYAAVVSQLASRGGTSDQRIAAKVAAVPALLDDVDRLLRARSPWS